MSRLFLSYGTRFRALSHLRASKAEVSGMDALCGDFRLPFSASTNTVI